MKTLLQNETTPKRNQYYQQHRKNLKIFSEIIFYKITFVNYYRLNYQCDIFDQTDETKMYAWELTHDKLTVLIRPDDRGTTFLSSTHSYVAWTHE